MPSFYSRLGFFSGTFLVSLAVAAATPPLRIHLQNASAKEKAAEQQLRRLAAQHDLGPWVQTTDLVIEQGAIPHSHPVLTLNTRHLDDDGLLVSTFIHEQAHWWLASHERETIAAVAELKSRYPTLPVGYPRWRGQPAGIV